MGTKTFLKENFATFIEYRNRLELRELLRNNIGEFNFLDFKQKIIDIPKLAKHLLGFANSGGGILIFGVLENDDGSFDCIGVEQLHDKTDLKKKLEKYIPYTLSYEIYNFSYKNEVEWREIKNKKFQVIFVDNTPEHLPFLSKKDHGNTLHKNRIYYRKNTCTEEASYDELQNLFNSRIETMSNTKNEIELKNQLDQLKMLYSYLQRETAKISPDKYENYKSLFLLNPSFPNETFEEFVSKIIEMKKRTILSIISKSGNSSDIY